MFSKALELTLNSAFAQAREKQHEYITVEHLLLALLDNPEASEILLACGANIERLRAGLGIFISETTPHLAAAAKRDIQPTLCFQRVLQRAIYQVQSSGRNEVTGANVLSAIFGEQESQAVYFLSQENVTRLDVVNYMTQGISKPESPQTTRERRGAETPRQQPEQPNFDMDPNRDMNANSEESFVDLYATNLNERARAGKVDPLIGRDKELQRTVQILCRRNKNNPIFVGEAGVGKTAIAEGLAQMIVNRQVPDPLLLCTVYSLDLGVLVAGTKYRGDFEKRFKAVLRALSRQSGAIVFIDEIHNLVGAGSATGGTMDASNLIKPLLSSGDLRCMGATTYDEYRNFISKDHALLRRFQKIDITEPDKEQTLAILQGLKPRFEKFHKVSFSDESLQKAVELSVRYMHDRFLPDKAIDIIDEAGAYQHLLPVAQRKKIIMVEDIERVVSNIARVPLQQLNKSDKQRLKLLPQKLKQLVFGQDQAIHALTDAIKLSRAGLRDPEKPVGSFLLAGPTGVGKTEITRQLAKQLGVELIRFDMSEYMERHAVSRLIGAPPGYVGYEQGGLLTEAVNKSPHTVLLLDEIEKAHPDIFNILLQVMDYGRLTDNNGRSSDFRHIILVMTTNAGADQLEKNNVGFVEQSSAGDSRTVINNIFTPEFRNRLDAVIEFKHLDKDTVDLVVDKCLVELSEQLAKQQVNIEVSSTAKQWLAIRGYDRKMGARPMARVIQEQLKQPLADELLFGRLTKSNNVRVNVKNDKLHFEFVEEAL